MVDPQTNACICPVPYTVDSKTGACGPAPTAVLGRATYKRKQAVKLWHTYCTGQGASACGVLGTRDGWECIDTMSDLESCASFFCLFATCLFSEQSAGGGCVIPLGQEAASGTDCSALPGVQDVSCVRGKCVVERCQEGFALLPADNSRCEPTKRATLFPY